MTGQFSETKNATKEIQVICDQVKHKVEKYPEFIAVKYREQIVAGQNFIIKVHVGGVNYIHLSVFQALPCDGGQVVLRGVQEHKTEDDPLVPF
ncbi:leukocyte cysteine proteinase inhibitor 1-like [Seriola dumerili]|uniref:leukocyte cysteine proteinase inhibitor 1-like n=1 Tax=Seriola dumerili TaxID=41447 RepID=UPI000BBEF589|nr:leukocyte cysteine proteinase inhibitor 1-like [Seriola dumerili]